MRSDGSGVHEEAPGVSRCTVENGRLRFVPPAATSAPPAAVSATPPRGWEIGGSFLQRRSPGAHDSTSATSRPGSLFAAAERRNAQVVAGCRAGRGRPTMRAQVEHEHVACESLAGETADDV